MKKLSAVYFSGTGNTAYAVNKFCSHFKIAGIDCKVFNIEEFDKVESQKFNADTVLVAYPIYGSDMPRIMKDFILNNPEVFQGRDLITLASQHSFSGDGGALAANLIKYKKAHAASIHINLPSNIADAAKLIKIKNGDKINKKLIKADRKIKRLTSEIVNGKIVKEGTSLFSRFAGFFVQRLWFKYFIEKRLRKGLKIDGDICSYCGKCSACCPMGNINISHGNINANDNCTLCYRCINLCPKKAISLISKNKPLEQYKGIEKND